jgi:hypothetical protein
MNRAARTGQPIAAVGRFEFTWQSMALLAVAQAEKWLRTDFDDLAAAVG